MSPICEWFYLTCLQLFTSKLFSSTLPLLLCVAVTLVTVCWEITGSSHVGVTFPFLSVRVQTYHACSSSNTACLKAFLD